MYVCMYVCIYLCFLEFSYFLRARGVIFLLPVLADLLHLFQQGQLVLAKAFHLLCEVLDILPQAVIRNER